MDPISTASEAFAAAIAGTNAVANAILPVTSLIEAYGVDGYWPEAAAYGTALGEIYSYQDMYPTADEGIFYNMDLLAEYLGEENKEEIIEEIREKIFAKKRIFDSEVRNKLDAIGYQEALLPRKEG